MCTSDRMSWGNITILQNGDFLPVAQMVEHGSRNVKITSSIPRESKNVLDWFWIKRCVCQMHQCKFHITIVWFDSSQVKSSHLYLYSAFNNTNCNKALHNIKIGKFVNNVKWQDLTLNYLLNAFQMHGPPPKPNYCEERDCEIVKIQIN